MGKYYCLMYMNASSLQYSNFTANMHPKNISIFDYTYQLPDEKIAHNPLAERDASKLLVYKNGEISQALYKNIADYLPNNSLMVINNTKVIEARILFTKPTGGIIEIFCLEPYQTINEYNAVMNTQKCIQYTCLIGGASKWKNGTLHITATSAENGMAKQTVTLSATVINKLADAYIVEFTWQPSNYTFAEILQLFGVIPLPPYIKRKANSNDKERYQTIFATQKGSVAAPTAALHFTKEIFTLLDKKNITQAQVTLHIGAGTFKPVKAANMLQHTMHSEWMDINTDTIAQLISKANETIVAVGTTALRTIESLYWMGVKSSLMPNATLQQLAIQQWDVYEMPLVQTNYTKAVALQSLLQWMLQNNMTQLLVPTQILIAPGYTYRVANAIVTNFHQPQSTLLLLVAAAVGDDWKKIYHYALQHDFRFLSYGDGSLLYLPTKA